MLGAGAGTGVVATENGNGVLHKTVLLMTGLSVAMGATALVGFHGSQKIYDFPAGNIYILGATTDITTLAGAGGISDTAALVGAIGTVAAATNNATLTGAEADVVPSVAGTLSGGAGVLLGKSITATGAVFDGTGTATDAILNFAVPDTLPGANDTLTVNGTITIVWLNLGDN